MLTQAAEDYLKTIYKLRRPGEGVSNSALAEALRVTPASVTGMVKQLAQTKLVRHVPYHGVELTDAGERVALAVIRRHRLLELYLANFLGYPWERVHEEADRLEHVISPELEDRLDAALGHPAQDPHGDPIPTKEGALKEPAHYRLADVAPKTTVVVRRVSDGDPEKLRYLAGLGLTLGAVVKVNAVEPFGGPLVVQVAGVTHAIGRELASTISVSPVPTRGSGVAE